MMVSTSYVCFFFFSSRRRHTRLQGDWSSDVCSSDLHAAAPSTFDREHAWPWLSYVIVGVARGRAGEMTSWTLSDDRAAFDEESITIEEQKAVWQSPS